MLPTVEAESLDDDLRDGARFCPGVFQDFDTNIRWHKILYAQGWIAPSWPKQYGGTGWDLMQRHIWTTEASLAGAPGVALRRSMVTMYSCGLAAGACITK